MIQNVIFWWVVPAAYTLVRAESRSQAVALSATFARAPDPPVLALGWERFP